MGKQTKSHLNNRDYNKFMKIEGEANLTLDSHKIVQAKAWDGLEGYLTQAISDQSVWSPSITNPGRSKRPSGSHDVAGVLLPEG